MDKPRHTIDQFKQNYSFQVYNNYIGKTPTIGKNMKSPLREEEHPSFNIYKDKNTGEYLWNDFAMGGGDCIKLLMLLKNIDFKSAIELLQQDFNCLIGDYQQSQHTFNNNKTPVAISLPETSTKTYNIIERSKFNQQEADYFNQYKITPDIVKKYNAMALDGYTLANGTTIHRKENDLIFCYKHNGWAKIYQPNSSYRFQHLGNKEADFIFGYDQLPESGELLIITGGEKDVLTLSSLGYNAISLNSETATMPMSKALDIKSRFDEIIVLYDLDKTGMEASEKLCRAHGFKLTMFPDGIFEANEKDVSDFVKKGFTHDDLMIVLNNAIFVPANEVIDPEKHIFNAVELLSIVNINPDYLMSPILPRIGTAVIAGKPDTGKSMFARQLAIQIANGLNDFLEFELKPIHNRAIYIATEDNKEATSYLLNKQLEGLNLQASTNLSFIFADELENPELLAELEKTLISQPVDIVVIDSFGDIFSGPDSNNNMTMRNTVRTFSRLSSKYNCLILFVHHINKGGYSLKPGQEHIQGGSGLVQKVRLAIQLSEGEGNTRYFTVVKGNYCPKDFKQNSIELDFSEETFLFTNTSNKIPTSDLGINPFNNNTDEKYTELVRIADEMFNNKPLSFGQFVEKFCIATGKSIPTAKRAHANLKKMEIIETCLGGYCLSTKISDELPDPDDQQAPPY